MTHVASESSFAAIDAPTAANSIDPTIHPKDNMGARDPIRYFGVGSDALRLVRTALDLAHPATPGLSPARVLDYACGFGRVARFLRVAFPGATIVAADAWRDAVDFVGGRFADHAVRIDPRVKAPPDLGPPFDLIWCGSLLTHLTPAGIDGTLDMFASALAPGGVCVVTTHGRFPRHRLASGAYRYNVPEATPMIEQFDAGQHGFAPYDGQTEYGASLSPLPVLAAWVASRPHLTLRMLAERAWDDHQDVLAFQRREVATPWRALQSREGDRA